MVFKDLCISVHWTKVASALEGLILIHSTQPYHKDALIEKLYSKEFRPSNHEWVKERLTSPTIHHVDFTQVPADVPNAYSDPNVHFDFNLKENRLIKLS